MADCLYGIIKVKWLEGGEAYLIDEHVTQNWEQDGEDEADVRVTYMLLLREIVGVPTNFFINKSNGEYQSSKTEWKCYTT